MSSPGGVNDTLPSNGVPSTTLVEIGLAATAGPSGSMLARYWPVTVWVSHDGELATVAEYAMVVEPAAVIVTVAVAVGATSVSPAMTKTSVVAIVCAPDALYDRVIAVPKLNSHPKVEAVKVRVKVFGCQAVEG